LSQLKKYHPSGNLKLNYLGIFQSLKLRSLMGKILSFSLELNFTPNTLGCYGLRKWTLTLCRFFQWKVRSKYVGQGESRGNSLKTKRRSSLYMHQITMKNLWVYCRLQTGETWTINEPGTCIRENKRPTQSFITDTSQDVYLPALSMLIASSGFVLSNLINQKLKALLNSNGYDKTAIELKYLRHSDAG